MSAPLLTISHVSKSYAGNPVLKDVELTFDPGRVYGLLGENGAGKSTLTRIVTGLETPDAGTLAVDGEPVAFRAPKQALARGIAVITQEQTLVLDRSVAENVLLGRLDRRAGFVDDSAVRRRFETVRDQVGFDRLEARTRVVDLSLAMRQQVEILRAIARGSRLIIMDEPTAILSSVETQQLLELIRRLAASGITILLISHFLEDVLAVADDVVVLRDGAVTYTGPAEGQTVSSLTRHMVGRLVEIDHQAPAPLSEAAATRLEVRGLRRADGIGPVDLSVRAGEIVGMAGLIGAGRTEIARSIFGADRRIGGQVLIDGAPVRAGSPQAGIAAGIGMITENRKEDGLSLVHSVRENASLVVRSVFARLGLRAVRREKEAVGTATRLMELRATSIEQPVWSLSGGNQQKVLFTRWTMARPKVLIVDEPTRGVDIGAKAQIHGALRTLAAEGMAILLISSDIEEVMGLSHRLLVVRSGRIVERFAWGEADRHRVIETAFGGPTEGVD
jgi:rhamnose transport system ATP-binding protein